MQLIGNPVCMPPVSKNSPNFSNILPPTTRKLFRLLLILAMRWDWVPWYLGRKWAHCSSPGSLMKEWIFGAIIIGRGKLKYSKKNLYQCHLIPHKSHVVCDGINPGLRNQKPSMFKYSKEPLASLPTIILINRYIWRMLLHLFLMNSATMGATGKDNFLKCIHCRPERTYTSNKPEFGVCCGGGERQADTRKKSRVAVPTLLSQGNILFRENDLLSFVPNSRSIADPQAVAFQQALTRHIVWYIASKFLTESAAQIFQPQPFYLSAWSNPVTTTV
jgi:hypothetical protein